MRKIRDFKLKTLYLAIYAGIIGVGWLLKVPCFWQWLLHIACPGCGMTRACMRVLQLDFVGAFSYHMMFWSIPVLLVYYYLDGRVFGKKWLDRGVLIAIAVGFFINWMRSLFFR